MPAARPLALGALLVLTACGERATPAAAPSPFSARVDSAVADAMKDGLVPGLAVTIVRGDSVLHSKGYGFANLEQRVPMTDSTPVVIGSTSKTVTSFAIMQLVDSGKVALDSTVFRYVHVLSGPGAPRPADPRFGRMTVRHLLTNVGGIPAGFSGDPFEVLDTATTALEDLVRHDMLPRRLDFAPGTGYRYSNRGFSLASLVVQDVSGVSYEDYIDTRIFAPLGMRHSTGRFWNGPGRGMVQGYRETTEGKPVAMPAALARSWTGSGMILSTSHDAARFMQAILNGGQAPGGPRVLSAASAAEILRAQQDAESEMGGPTKYGLAWEISSMNGTTIAMKGGSVVAMGSLFVMLPGQKVGVAMVFNAIDYGKLGLLANLLKILAGAPTDPYKPLPVAPPVPPSEVTLPATTMQRVAGTYETMSGLMRVELRGDTLAGRWEGDDIRLEPTSDSSFVVRSRIREMEGTPVTIRPCSRTLCMWIKGDSNAVRR